MVISRLLVGGASALVLAACAATPTTPAASTSPTGTGSSTTPPGPAITSPTPTSSRTPTPSLTSSPAATDMAALPACRTQQLVLTQHQVEGTAGSFYATYFLGNRGPGTCRLTGYPGFALLFANGGVIQHPATRTGAPYRTVAVRAGGHGQFVVRTVDATIPGTGCSPSWHTAFVQVYPPGQTTPIRQPSRLPACNLSVGPVTAP